MNSLNTSQYNSQYTKQSDVPSQKLYHGFYSRPTTAQTTKKNSFSSSINTIVNGELNSNHILNEKSMIYQSHMKSVKLNQATYLRPESVNKITQSGLIVPFNELVSMKKNRSKSLGNNIFMNNQGGEIMEEILQDDLFVNKQASEYQGGNVKDNQNQQQRERDASNKQKKPLTNTNDKKQKQIIVVRPQSSNIVFKNKRSTSVTTLQKQNVNVDEKKSQIEHSNALDNTLNVFDRKFIEQKLQQNPQSQMQATAITGLHKLLSNFSRDDSKTTQEGDISLKAQLPIYDNPSLRNKIDGVRENYYTNLKNLLQIADRDVVILQSKQLFETSFGTMKKVVEDYDIIIKELKGRILRLNNENAELETNNEWLKRLTNQLEKQKAQMGEEQESLIRQLKELNLFKDSYILMQTKFKNTNLQKLITDYEITDRKAFKYLTRANMLEDEKSQLEKLYKEAKDRIRSLQRELDKYELSSNDSEKQKYGFGYIGREELSYNNKQNAINPEEEKYNYLQKDYKTVGNISQTQLQKEYDRLFNRILDLFNKILQRKPVLSLDDTFQDCNLDDPFDILNTIDKIMTSGGPDNIQNEMKRIIAASNKLIKSCYDEQSADLFNEHNTFDCETIYNKVLLYVNQLKMNIKSLKNQVASYKLLIKN